LRRARRDVECRAMLRAALLLPVLVLAACASGPRAEPDDEERRLLAYLVRDPYVEIVGYERDVDGFLIVDTRQGNGRQRYLIAPDDPARPGLRLRRLDDESRLETAPNPRPGGGPPERGN